MHDEKLAGVPLRLYFTYLRTCIVSGTDRPCSWPYCHYVAWEALANSPGKMRVWFVRCDLPGDGHKLRLRHRRSGPIGEQIVCAKRLSGLPPRRWQHKPTRTQRKQARLLLDTRRQVSAQWSAEFEPIPLWPTRWMRWFGLPASSRKIVLESETKLVSLGGLSYDHSFALEDFSYLRLEWFYPKRPNQIRSTDHPNRNRQIVGFFEVDPARQSQLQAHVNRVLTLDHSGTRKLVFGIHPPDDWTDCVTVDSLWPGCEPTPATEAHLKVVDEIKHKYGAKMAFLESRKETK